MRLPIGVWVAGWCCLVVGLTSVLAQAPGEKQAAAQEQATTPETQTAPTGSGTATIAQAQPAVPTWASEARWYEVVVEDFRDGAAPTYPENPPRSGGDLQGLSQKLPYLKELGVNALCLAPIFAASPSATTNLLHVAEALSAKDSAEQAVAETADPATWRFTPGDRVFLKFLADAHAQGLRVVVSAALTAEELNQLTPEVERTLFAGTQRWLDPDRDGNPSDGVDGWRIAGVERLPHACWQRWRTHVKRVNPDALLIADVQDKPADWLKGDMFDVVINDRVGRAVARFFAQADSSYTLEKFCAELDAIRGELPHDTNVALLNRTSSSDSDRLLGYLAKVRAAKPVEGHVQPAPRDPTEGDLVRWRLANIFLHYYVGAPLTYYGDEVGMAGSSAGLGERMWWSDLPNQKHITRLYRGDLYALVRMLHTVREVHEAVRVGAYRSILLDGEKQVLVFGRKVPGKEVVLALNYGDNPQRVKFALGKPGQLVGVLTPQLTVPTGKRSGRNPPRASSNQSTRKHASTKIPDLNYGKGRQLVSQAGEVTLDLKPESMRLLLVWDEEPQKPAKQEEQRKNALPGSAKKK